MNYLQAMRDLTHEAPCGHLFHKNYRVLEDDKGATIPIEIMADDVVRYVTWDAVVDAIIACGEKNPYAPLMPADAVKVMQFFRATGPRIEESEIATVRQKNEPGYCWHRLGFNIESGECPTFDEIIGRMSNARAFMAYIGSMLDVDSDRQQYLWLYGKGQNGKSSIGRVLEKIFGPSYRAEVVPQRGDRFWTSGLLGSRVVVFSDCTEYHFPKSGLFKSLTGSDPVRMERKGQQPMTAHIQTKFIFFSNETPDLKDEVADRRRAIFCELAPLAEGTIPLPEQVYNKMLWAEVSAFLAKCWATYIEATNDRQLLIPTETEDLDDLISSSASSLREEKYDIIIDSLLKPTENVADYVLPAEIHTLIFDHWKMSEPDRRGFYKYLKEKLGARHKKSRYIDGKIRAVWVNIAWQEDVINDNMRVINRKKLLHPVTGDTYV